MPLQLPPSICPVCLEPTAPRFCLDRRNQNGNYSLFQCSACAVQFWVPFQSLSASGYQKLYSPEYALRAEMKPRAFRDDQRLFFKLHRVFPPGTKVLDVGCGTGEILYELNQLGCETWGIDFNEAAVAIARQRSLKNVFPLSVRNLGQMPNLPKFDYVTVFQVLEHVEKPLELISDMKNLLKPGGTLVVAVPSRDRLLVNHNHFEEPPFHLTRWNESAISSLFAKIGFQISRVDYCGTFYTLHEALTFGTGLLTKKIRSAGGDRTLEKKITRGAWFRILHAISRLKDVLLTYIPAGILWVISELFNRRNGLMYVELKETTPEK